MSKFKANSDTVRWAYRLFLDREPENSQVINNCSGLSSVQLREFFLSSDEYRQRNMTKSLSQTNAPPIHIEHELDEDTFSILVERVSRVWTALGETKPHWSVLSSEQFKPENIKDNRHEFYKSGAGDLATLNSTLSRLGFDHKKFSTFLEFGCGLGRVTGFFSKQFKNVIAVDVSKSHLEYAMNHLRELGVDNVSFKLAEVPDFGMGQLSYDLWFSRIVLQHNSPPIIAKILKIAFRKLNPGGVAVFQVPTYALGYSFRIKEYLSSGGSNDIEMHCLAMNTIFDIICKSGCIPVEVTTDDSVGVSGWVSTQFVVKKPTRSNLET